MEAKPFDIKTIPLEGSHFIEASAGTGKTHNIGLLTLRLLLEKALPLERILVVTFARDAAGELQERTERFIRMGIALLDGKLPRGKDPSFESVVWSDDEATRKSRRELLYQALLALDKASITTIHAFSLRTLQEFAFESGEAFGQTLVEDPKPEIMRSVREVYRILSGPEFGDQLRELDMHRFSFWKKMADKFMEGRELDLPPTASPHDPDPAVLRERLLTEGQLRALIQGNLEEYRDRVRAAINTPGRRNQALALLENADILIDYLRNNDSPAHGFPNYLHDVIDLLSSLKPGLLRWGLEEVRRRTEERLRARNGITYGDMIRRLHAAMERDGMVQALRERFDAALVDEFQDTDRTQYGIFKAVFVDCPEKVAFFIGDPKQTIYTWRQADLLTYFRARQEMEGRCWTMGANYRSSKAFVEAVNAFFREPQGDRGFFQVMNGNSPLRYHEVSANWDRAGNPGLVTAQGEALQALLCEKGDPEALLEKWLVRLLFSGMTLEGAPVRPRDIAILARTNKQVSTVKRLLIRLGIPSVNVDGGSVFGSLEAGFLEVLLRGIRDTSRGVLAEILAHPVCRIASLEEVERADYDRLSNEFRLLRERWEDKGFQSMMARALELLGLEGKWVSDPTRGYRVLTNIGHLSELLHEKATRHALGMAELHDWLANLHREATGNGSSAEDSVSANGGLRVEHDGDAVRVMTIHKSKGLEFPVVLLPYLADGFNTQPPKLYSREDEVSGESRAFVMPKGLAGNGITVSEINDLVKLQQQEERRRLMYVAITRARFHGFILTPDVNVKNEEPYILHAMDRYGDLWNEADHPDMFPERAPEIHDTSTLPVQQRLPFPALNLHARREYLLSYSGLAVKSTPAARPYARIPREDRYESFVFDTLPRGKQMGTLVHALLEWIDFTDETTWDGQIARAIAHHAPSREKDTDFAAGLRRMLDHVLRASITLDGQAIDLRRVGRESRIHELEFHFTVPQSFQTQDLQQAIESTIPDRSVQLRPMVASGMMNGSIDLFFEHGGRYYILDWKSNFLGDRLEDYGPEQLADAMNASNYHLQYLLYATAADRYLRSRLPGYDFGRHFGGVIYLFLRGAREGQTHGVYTQRVTRAEIDAIEGVLSGAPVA